MVPQFSTPPGKRKGSNQKSGEDYKWRVKMEQQSNTQEDEAPLSNISGWLFAVARADRAKSLPCYVGCSGKGPVLDRSGPGIPRSIPYPEFGLRSRAVRSGPGPMHTPKCNSSIRPTSSRNIAY